MIKNNRILWRIVACMFLAVIACFSIFRLSAYMTDPSNHAETIQFLDEKIKTVMELTGASTAVSAAVSALPGDMATPVAEKLADFSTYFLFVLCVLYLEKYLVTITGAAAFRFLLPLACGFLGASFFWKPELMRKLSLKLALFAIAIFTLIPMSVNVSNMIYATYTESIDETLQNAADTKEQANEITAEADSDSSLLSQAVSWFTDETSKLTDKAVDIVSDFVEALAVMIVTSCLIPLLVLLFFWWLIRMALGLDTKQMPVMFSPKDRILHS